MSTTGAQQYAEVIIASLEQAASAAHWDLITEHKPAIMDAAEGDLITVIQPDGQRDTYRIAGSEPTAGGFGVLFDLEPAEGR